VRKRNLATDSHGFSRIRQTRKKTAADHTDFADKPSSKFFLDLSAFIREIRGCFRSCVLPTANNQESTAFYLLAILAHLLRLVRNGKAAAGELTFSSVVLNGCTW